MLHSCRCGGRRSHGRIRMFQTKAGGMGLIGLLGIVVGASIWITQRRDSHGPSAMARAAESTEPICRRTPYAAIERSSEGEETTWRVHGEQNVDVPGVQISVVSGSGSAI